MSLVQHARRELELAGVYRDDPAYAQSIAAAVAAFASYGHSGGSASVGIITLHRLLQFQPLTDLTDDPAEWHEVGVQDGKVLWQSARMSQAFSTDGGKSYYTLDERDQAGCSNADAPRHDTVRKPAGEEPPDDAPPVPCSAP